MNPGNLAKYPPLEKDITITTGDDGMPSTATQSGQPSNGKILSSEYQLS